MEREYSFNTMECADFSIKLPAKTIHRVLLYRPLDRSILQFYQELTTYLEQNINTTGDTLLMGDLNIHINDLENQDIIICEDSKESLGLCNHANFPTHRLQNRLEQSLLQKIQTSYQTLIKAHYSKTIISSTTC